MVGREKEKRLLLNAYEKKGPQFVAIYGRRRIGKTYLVNEILGPYFSFTHAGVAPDYAEKQSREKQQQIQLKAFSLSLRRFFGTFGEEIKDWFSAFFVLESKLDGLSKDKRKVIFFDELAWMDTPDSDFLKAFEQFYNGFVCLRSDIMIVCCASATTWMLNNIINNAGGLFGRVTTAIHLLPFTLKECLEYSQERELGLTKSLVIKYYMVLGGVAHYWDQLEPDQAFSFEKTVDSLFFSESALLKNEFQYLYRTLFKNESQYINIVTTLGEKKKGMTREELLKKTKSSSNGEFTKKLNDLKSCDLIREYVPFGKEKKGSLFQLVDNFTLFYLEFVSQGITDESYFLHSLNTPRIANWEGRAFEMVCLENVNSLKNALGISGVATEVSSFRCLADEDHGTKGHQIDLVISRADRIVHLCEMKYSEKPFLITKKMHDDWITRAPDFAMVTKTKFAVIPTMVTPYGLERNKYASDFPIVLPEDALFMA